jgi:hypothetical protein
VHSSDPRFWKEQEGYDFLLEQKEFLAQGGEVESMIIGEYPFENVSIAISETKYNPIQHFIRHAVGAQNFSERATIQDYADVLILMHICRIKVYYAQGQSGDNFMSFSLGGKKILMRWQYAHRLGTLERCAFEEGRGEAKRNWERVARNADPVASLIQIPELSVDRISRRRS